MIIHLVPAYSVFAGCSGLARLLNARPLSARVRRRLVARPLSPCLPSAAQPQTPATSAPDSAARSSVPQHPRHVRSILARSPSACAAKVSPRLQGRVCGPARGPSSDSAALGPAPHTHSPTARAWRPPTPTAH